MNGTAVDVEGKFKEIIMSYMDFQPILFELHKRNNGCHVVAVLNEMRALNDHIARCYLDGVTEDFQYEELCKAEGHLKRVIYDCFKQLDIIFYENVRRYERNHFGVHWLLLNGGTFWVEYNNLQRNVLELTESAKTLESSNSEKAFDEYQKAYVEQDKLYRLLDAHAENLQLRWCDKLHVWIVRNKMWIASAVVLSIIASIISRLIG